MGMTAASAHWVARAVAAACALGFACAPGARAQALDDPAARAARWKEVGADIFGARAILPGDARIQIDAPARALDAALVPITLTMTDTRDLAAVHLVIDENPAPYAADVRFGPAADPHQITLRVRVNDYTNLHAVAETTDGRLFATARFIKASGGCSAPVDVSESDALAGMGQMRMRFAAPTPGAASTAATLMIRHPNFNGMQMNQVSRQYTPARFIKTIQVNYAGRKVFSLDGDISISADPVIGFAFLRAGPGRLEVTASDNAGGRWAQSFDVPAPAG